MKWGRNEIDLLSPILEQVSSDLAPVDGKHILVLCSATGEVAFWLGEMMEQGKVTGVELDGEALEIARRSAHEMGLEAIVEFQPAEQHHIPAPDASFDALVSEFIVYPTTVPAEISQAEMARVLKPGGRLILTEVLLTSPLPAEVREELEIIGLDYLCEATLDDFHTWMVSAGLEKVELQDLTPSVRALWEDRREADRALSHQQGYSYLLDHPEYALGKAIFYISARAEKPKINP
jgi:ubiquinone/menaquinone biosynthesis C-methylase UbiE